jgi:hypothetical protein
LVVKENRDVISASGEVFRAKRAVEVSHEVEEETHSF